MRPLVPLCSLSRCGRRPLCTSRAHNKLQAQSSAAPLPAHILARQRRRAAETRRFGAPVYAILGVGACGVAAVMSYFNERRPETWQPLRVSDADRLEPFSLVTEQRQVELLLSEVRVVLARFGIGLGNVPLRVRLLDERSHFEGTTTKVLRPPPLLRGVEAVSLRRGLTAVSAAQVLAHEYTHAWLWLTGFPVLDPRLEEGLCELLSYLFLLSCLRDEPPEGGGVLAREPEALRAQVLSIEANAHPEYGGGFRDAVEALRGRTLHELLGHVRQHGTLPPAGGGAQPVGGGAPPAAAAGEPEV